MPQTRSCRFHDKGTKRDMFNTQLVEVTHGDPCISMHQSNITPLNTFSSKVYLVQFSTSLAENSAVLPFSHASWKCPFVAGTRCCLSSNVTKFIWAFMKRGSWWFLSQANSKLEGTHCFSDVIYFSERAWLSTWYMSGLNGHTKVLVTSLVPWTWEKGHMCSQTKEAMGSRDVFSHSLDFWVVNMKGLQLSFPHER